MDATAQSGKEAGRPRTIILFGLFLACWALTGIFLIANLVIGFVLSRTDDSLSIMHLILGLGALIFGLASHFLLMKESQRQIELVASNLKEKPELREVIRLGQKKALAAGLFCLAFIVVSLITGTISHAGKFPLIHAILGLVVSGFSVQAFILWIKLRLKFQSF